MGFREDVARIAQEAVIRGLAIRRAGSRELAEDAIQMTWWNVARVKDPERIDDLHAFFCKSLLHEIHHQRTRPTPIPVEDIVATTERESASPPGDNPPASVENRVAFRLLAETLLHRLERDHDQLMASVPGRSPDHRRYRTAIVAAAKTILLFLLEGAVTSADWNAALQAEYPQWCSEPGLTRATTDQRLSRARRDVRLLLQKILSRHELGY
jgi:DNA-directed RNA polymerase specialized sigma24 family protein